MIRVVDTSVAVKWVVPETGVGMEADVGSALLLLQRGLMAPDFMIVEFANAMWKKVRRGEIPSEQAHESLRILPELLTFHPGRAFVGRALEISLELKHPLYDCIFLALAESLGVELVTADARFIKACAGTPFGQIVRDLQEGLAT